MSDEHVVHFERVSYDGAPPSCLVVFVKAPRLGTVKTRLAAGLGDGGDAKALAVHRRLAERTISVARKVERPDYPIPGESISLVVATTPADAIAEVSTWLGAGPRDDGAWLRRSFPVVAQRGGDLGERMANAMADAFESGARRVAIIGTDAPKVRALSIRNGLSRLREVDLVLGPASDGGYWFIAAQNDVPPVFSGVDWSTPRVLSQTLALAERAGLSVAKIETLDDIDTAEDLARYPDLLG